MKKIILVSGLVAGFVSAAWCMYSQNWLSDSVSLNERTVSGYASMIVAFSVIFVGVKNYRDKQNGGIISFGEALKISLLITLVASTIYVLFWLIDYYLIIPDFGGKYTALMRSQMMAEGKSAADIQKQMADMNEYASWYKNPVLNVLISYSTIAPVGIVISVISSLILKRKSKPVAANS